MSSAWVVFVGLGLAATSIFWRFWHRADPTQDLGAVSNQWIAEHRLGTSQDSRR
jgi:hypothetical protein